MQRSSRRSGSGSNLEMIFNPWKQKGRSSRKKRPF
jgi:hypothetical protein